MLAAVRNAGVGPRGPRNARTNRDPEPSLIGRPTAGFSIGGDQRIDFRGWPHAEILDPLNDVERRAVSDRISQDVICAAIQILKEEKNAREQLNLVHIKPISLMCVAAVGVAFSVVYLRMVLVPFIVAIFFFFLLEPLLHGIIHSPAFLQRLVPWPLRIAEQLQTVRGVGASAAADAAISENCGEQGRVILASAGVKIWAIIAVLLCLIALIIVGAAAAFFMIEAITDFPWSKYRDSERLQLVLESFPELPAEPDDFEAFLPWLMQGPLVLALGVTLSFISQAFLTFLFISFLLMNAATHGTSAGSAEGIVHKVRRSVQRYIRIKTCSSLVVAMAVGTFYWRMRVDMWFVFTVATYVLCYIPHVGATVAVIMPLPVVFLDPDKRLIDVIVVFLFPFLVHQLATNLVEPRLLARSLDLHPIVVLLALAFWTSVWGAMGAVLCVPLTAVVRLVLLEIKHPYVLPIVGLLKGQLQAPPSEDDGLRGDAGSAERVALQGPHVELDDLNASGPAALADVARPSMDPPADRHAAAASCSFHAPAVEPPSSPIVECGSAAGGFSASRRGVDASHWAPAVPSGCSRPDEAVLSI